MRTALKTMNIKGKEYVEVNTRIAYFRESGHYEGYSMETEIVELTDARVVMRAVVRNPNDRIVATGMAYEKSDSSYINKTSYIENCETSAWGRALGNLGIGISSSIASKEEVENAIHQQDQTPPKATIDLDAKYDSGDNHHKIFLKGVFDKLGVSDPATWQELSGYLHTKGVRLADMEREVSDVLKEG